ncbi:MAG: hypothetical protein ACRC3Z_05675 [Phocaeicola sp.]
MRRIEIAQVGRVEKTRIEHLLSREKHPERKLDYSNMVLCCDGKINSQFHCDVLKGADDINFNLFTDTFITTLSYGEKSGEIKSSMCCYNDEINRVINLNHKLLKANRAAALNGVKRWLQNEGWTLSLI